MAVFSQKKNPDPTCSGRRRPRRQPVFAVGKTLLIKGDIFSDEEILIDGKVQGKITVKNRVIVGRDGNRGGRDRCPGDDHQGQGHRQCASGSQRVEIVPAGVLHGNIHSPRVVIADSGVFEGNIEMHGARKKASPGKKNRLVSHAQGNDAASSQKSHPQE